MLRQQHQLFRSILLATDTGIVAAAALAAYFIRFRMLDAVRPVPDAVISYPTHGIPILAAVPIMVVMMIWSGLYRPRRDQRFYYEAGTIIKAVTLGVALTIALLTTFRGVLYEGRNLSAGQYLIYGLVAAATLLVWRYLFRTMLRSIRRRGWNLRHVAIIGTGRLGQVACHTLLRNTWTGIKPAYFISHHDATRRRTSAASANQPDGLFKRVPVRGCLDDLEQLLRDKPVSGVFIALPGKGAALLPELLLRLERFPLDVRIVPDMNPRYMPVNMAVSELDGMPVLSVRESPLNGWGRVSKRLLDIVGSVLALTIFAIPMLLIGLLVRLSGPGPVIFRQERMTLNGQRFRIFKFRTMKHASAEALALRNRGKGMEAWTARNDPRITPIGRVLRRFSLDELPQLLNVLLGEMSLVGPRPEMAELIDRFREDWRGYVLRQHVKAGITGWAQVNGLRGDSSLKKRIQYDLFYIRNWSITFDLRILWMTLFRGFAHPNAH